MKNTILALATAGALALSGCGGGGDGGGMRTITVVGSSTVYPFTKAVAENFARGNPTFGSPVVESTGTGGGMQLFCAGVGASHPDIVNASRRMKSSEFESCRANGVDEIIELQVGIDGLVLVAAPEGPEYLLTLPQIYEALAASPYGEEQTNESWSDIDPSLPDTPIRVYGPPPTSGTRDSFVELMLVPGCNSNAAMAELEESDEDRHEEICTQLREDGAFIEAGENDNLIVQKVTQNPGYLGILGYSFLEENEGRVTGVPIEGVAPTYETIAGGEYPGARPLFIYVKGNHLDAIRGLREFVAEYVSAWGDDGYLSEEGMIASPAATREAMSSGWDQLTTVRADQLES